MNAYISILYAGSAVNDNLVKMKPVNINTGGYYINETVLKNLIMMIHTFIYQYNLFKTS